MAAMLAIFFLFCISEVYVYVSAAICMQLSASDNGPQPTVIYNSNFISPLLNSS